MNTNGAAAKTGKKREHRGGQRKGGQTLSRNTAMLKRGRPQSVVQQHADISYTYTTDQKVRYSFSCKYCKKAKQTCSGFLICSIARYFNLIVNIVNSKSNFP